MQPNAALRIDIDRVIDTLKSSPSGVAAAYLYGSVTSGGLRPDSDVNFLVLVDERLAVEHGRLLTERRLRISAARSTGGTGRVFEVTVVALPETAMETSFPAALNAGATLRRPLRA